MKDLKLNMKHTFLIGLAFFATLLLWQVYNNYCPLILDYLLPESLTGTRQLVIGSIMALDNVVALIIMPLFGVLSDRTKTKLGRRMPYILAGMLLTGIVLPFVAVSFYYSSLVGVLVTMALILVIMQAYRNPVVSLMPDITPKPLRSKANGIINLVGYAGAVIAAVMGMVWGVKKDPITLQFLTPIGEAQNSFLFPFSISAGITLVLMVVLFIFVKENKIVAEAATLVDEGEKQSETFESVEHKLSKPDKRNLFILLGSIFLWFMAFNAVETFNSQFAAQYAGGSGVASTGVIILTASSILSFLLFAGWAKKLGRKTVIIIGLCTLVFAFVLVGVLVFVAKGLNIPFYEDVTNGGVVEHIRTKAGTIVMIAMYASSAILGFGWALININSYPMVVELANKNNVGKYTGLYYVGSMLAQSITPILLGLLIWVANIDLSYLYLYSAVFALLALGLFFFVKQSKKPIEVKSGLEALDQD